METCKISKKITGFRVIKNTEVKFEQHSAPKRPKELTCHIHHVKVQGEAWTILIGLLDNKPYEVFGGLSKFIEIPKKVKDGIISKSLNKDKTSCYSLAFGEGENVVAIKDVVNVFENVNNAALSRMISLSLRHGAHVQYVVEQLQKDKHSEMQSFSRVIARVLKNYIPEGTTSSATKKCEDCGAEGTLVYQEGCLRCVSCGSSKCS